MGSAGVFTVLALKRDQRDIDCTPLSRSTEARLWELPHLADRMAVPSRARAGFEGDQAAGCVRRCHSCKQRLNANRASKAVGRPILRSLWAAAHNGDGLRIRGGIRWGRLPLAHERECGI